jgi:hypothetical protein
MAAIEGYRHRSTGPEIPDALREEYVQALRGAEPVALGILHRGTDHEGTCVVLGMLALIHGHTRLGMAITDLEPEVACPSCEHLFPVPGWDLNEPDDDEND